MENMHIDIGVLRVKVFIIGILHFVKLGKKIYESLAS